jgi:hypothetical protein
MVYNPVALMENPLLPGGFKTKGTDACHLRNCRGKIRPTQEND